MDDDYRALRPEETEALQAFADAHGKRWKDTLVNTYWYNARIWRGPGDSSEMGHILHSIRNELGSEWLHDVCRITPRAKP